MPNAIKYTPSKPTGAIQKGIVSLGVSGSFGPTGTTGWYSGITPQSGKYIIYETNASYAPRIYAPQNADELKRVALQLGASTGDITTETAILSWFATQTNYQITNFEYPPIVTNGLVRGFDANYSGSYPNNGIDAWYDLSGGTQYSSNVGNPSWANNVSEITICVLLEKFYTTTGYAYHPINKWNSGYDINASFILYQFENYLGNNADGFCQWYGYTSNNGWTGLTQGYGGFRLIPGQIAQICMQYNSSNGGGQMWYNGTQIGSRSGTSGTIGPTSGGYSDTFCYGPLQVGPLKVHQVLFYNRELTDAEMIQNYNAISSRIVNP
jgi:hypothetical protein